MASGSSLIYIVSVTEPDARHPILAGRAVIGRDAGSAIRLDYSSISRSHALLERDLDRVYLSDIGSRNGTFVNGERLVPGDRRPLRHNDRVRFATKEYVVIGETGEETWETTQGHPNESPTWVPAEENSRRNARVFGFAPSAVAYIDQGVELDTANQLAAKYRPIQLIKSGGMGRIFLAQEVLSGRFVALKVMIESMLYSDPHVQQFIREAVITARLQHPHIIPVYDLGFIESNQLYYTMRYVDGENLAGPLRRAPLRASLGALYRAALAVHYAHTLGLWHRDLKPENILVDRSGDVFVIDWGLVTVQAGKTYQLDLPQILVDRKSFSFKDKLMEETKDAISTLSFGVGMLSGTPAYMSPEQCRNQADLMGPTSDVWAFGVMLHEALTGSHPLGELSGLKHGQVIERVRTRAISVRGEMRPEVTAELELLCREMLVDSPALRLHTLDAFLEIVTDFLRLPRDTRESTIF